MRVAKYQAMFDYPTWFIVWFIAWFYHADATAKVQSP